MLIVLMLQNEASDLVNGRLNEWVILVRLVPYSNFFSFQRHRGHADHGVNENLGHRNIIQLLTGDGQLG